MDGESLTLEPRGAGLPLWRLIRQALSLWVGGVLLIPGAVFSTVGIQLVLTDRSYATRGLTASATVLDKSIVHADRSGNSRTRYMVRYRFASAQGQQTEGSSEVSVDQWEGVDAGSALEVTYLPDAPSSSRRTGSDEWIAAYVFSAIGGVFAVVGGGLTFGALRALRRTLRISREGFATSGTVVRVAPVSTSINRVRQWRIEYEYRDYLGQARQGQSYLLSPGDAARWRDGDTGTVRCDRERPELSVWMGEA